VIQEVGWDADRKWHKPHDVIVIVSKWEDVDWGGAAAHCIAILEPEGKVLDIELQIRKNELSR